MKKGLAAVLLLLLAPLTCFAQSTFVIPLNNPTTQYLPTQSVSQQLLFTRGPPAVAGADVRLELIADGNAAHIPIFSPNFTDIGGQPWVNTAGAVNVIRFWFDGTNGFYQIDQPGATYSTSAPRAETLIGCAPDTINQPYGCDFVVTGLVGTAGSVTGAEVALNSQIASCGSANTPTFTGQTTGGNTLTITGTPSGVPVYIGMPLNGTGITAAMWISAFGTGTGGAGTYTVSGTVVNVGPETMTGSQGGCKIKLRAGTYNTCGTITIDRSFIDIEGENSPMWGGYITNITSTPVGTVGIGATKIQANGTTGTFCSGSVDGYDLIKEVWSGTVPADDGEQRHRGVRVAWVYLVGPKLTANWDVGSSFGAGSPAGIRYTSLCDLCKVEHVTAQHLVSGVIGGSDNGTYDALNIQDCYHGFAGALGPLNRVTNSDFYDLRGEGVTGSQSGGWGTIIANNSFGDTNQNDGFSSIIANPHDAVIGNLFSSTYGGAIRANGSVLISGNLIDYTQGQATASTRTVAAILMAGGGNSTITNNQLVSTSGANEQEYAIDLGSTTGTLVSNNSIQGTWKSNTQPYINQSAVGNNALAMNYGDINTPSGVPTISSGFGSSPSVTHNNGCPGGQCVFSINVGTGGTATSGVIGLPTARDAWSCTCSDTTTQSSSVFVTKQTASSTASCTVTDYNTAATATAWTASDVLQCTAGPN